MEEDLAAKCPPQSSHVPLACMFKCIANQGKPSLVKSANGSPLCNLLLAARINRPLVVGMCFCKERVGTLPRWTPKMRKQLLWLLSTFSDVGGKTSSGWVGKVGSNDISYLECKEQILLRKNPNPSKRNFEWGSRPFVGASDVDGSTTTHLRHGDGYLELWVEWDHMGHREFWWIWSFFNCINL